MKNVKSIVKAWLPVAIWCGIIFYLSHQPNLNAGISPFWNFALAKTAHVTEYFILTLLVYRAMKMSEFKTKILSWSVVFSLLYACSDEWHQLYILGRTSTYRDVLIDGVGILLAVLWIKYRK